MASTLIDSLTLSDAAAKKIIKIAIEQNAYDSDMPTTKKERQEAAHEIVAFCVDAWANDGARPDDDDPDIAEGAEAILKIFEIADIEADDDGNIEFPNAEEEDDEEDEDEEEDEEEDDDDEDDEGPFDPDDYIEDGYTELNVATRIKRLKALDSDDEDDEAILRAIYEWEQSQDKPASRVLNYLEETLELEDEEDEDEDEEEEVDGEVEEDEDEDEEDDEGEEDDEETEEPWEGYNEDKVSDIKAKLQEAFDDQELEPEHLDYIEQYENEVLPKARTRVLKYVEDFRAALNGNGDEDEEDEPEEKPKRGKASASKSKPKDKPAGVTIRYTVGDDEFEVEGVSELEVVV